MKPFLKGIGIVLSIALLYPIVFETSDWGLHYLDNHSFFQRWPLMIFGLVSAFLAGGIIGGFEEYWKGHFSETFRAETRYNPAMGWAIASFIIQLAIIALLE